MGDCNSRTGTLNDFVVPYKFICESQGNVSLLNENLSIIQCLERNNIPIKRSSADQVRNVYGNQLIEFCKNNDLFIVNGRLNKSNSPPKTTCNDKSTIDYFISTAYNFDFLHSFEVQDFNSLFSDSHCPLALEIDVCLSENTRVRTNRKGSNTHEARLWIDGKKDEYLQNFDSKRVDEILDKLTGLNIYDKLSQLDIDNIVRDIECLFTENAKTTFGYKKTRHHETKNNNKPWFKHTCRKARNNYHSTRRLYNKYKNEHYKNLLKQVSREYKSTINQSINKFKTDKINQLKSIKNKNPKAYWKVINSADKTEQPTAPLHELYDFFKHVNNPTVQEGSINQRNEHNTTEINNEDINQPITEKEITETIKTLKNNK